jgi:hypothetical protein
VERANGGDDRGVAGTVRRLGEAAGGLFEAGGARSAHRRQVNHGAVGIAEAGRGRRVPPGMTLHFYVIGVVVIGGVGGVVDDIIVVVTAASAAGSVGGAATAAP